MMLYLVPMYLFYPYQPKYTPNQFQCDVTMMSYMCQNDKKQKQNKEKANVNICFRP